MKFINIVTLCCGTRYSNYLNVALDRIEKAIDLEKNIVNIFITCDSNFEQLKTYKNINVYINLIEKPKNLKRHWEFPFFLKNEAIKFAVKKINSFKENESNIYKLYAKINNIQKDSILFLDADVFIKENFQEVLTKIKSLNDGIYVNLNKRTFQYYKNKKHLYKKITRLKNIFNIYFNNINYSDIFLNLNPNISIFWIENIIIFNLSLEDIQKICERWDSIISKIKDDQYIDYRGECCDIAIAAYLENINIDFIQNHLDKSIKTYFEHINKKKFDNNNLNQLGYLK